MINFLEELFMLFILVVWMIWLFFIFKSWYYVFAEIFSWDINYLKYAMEYSIRWLVLLIICEICDSVILKALIWAREKKI